MGTHINAWLCACVHACGDQRKRSIVSPCCSLCDCLKTGSPPDPEAYRASYTCCPVNCWDLPVSGPNAEGWEFELRSSGPRSWKESALTHKATSPAPSLMLFEFFFNGITFSLILTWNKECFSSLYIQISVAPPGPPCHSPSPTSPIVLSEFNTLFSKLVFYPDQNKSTKILKLNYYAH